MTFRIDAEENKRTLDLLWAFCVLIVIIGSLLPAQSAAMQSLASLHVNDKVEHFGAYATLAFLPTLYKQNLRLGMRLLFSIALGIALEFGQLFSPGRSFDTIDMLADGAGTVAGFLMGLWIRRSLLSEKTS